MNFIDGEVPMQFPGNRLQLSHAPSPKESVILVHNGTVLFQDLDYTIEGTFVVPAPHTTMFDFTHFRAWYRY